MRNRFSSRLDAKVLRVYPRAEVAEERGASCRQKLGAEGPLIIAGGRLECSWLEDLPDSSEKKMRQSINSSTSFALTIIKAETISRELLGPAKRA